MKLPRLLSLAAFGAGAATALLAADSASATPAKLPSGFSTQHMDLSVDPKVDFAQFAAGGWYKNFQMPADKSRFGAFDTLEQNNWTNLKAILEDVSAKTHAPGSIEQKVGDFFASAMDTAAIDAAGTRPIERQLVAVANIRNLDDLSRVIATFRRDGAGGGLFSAFVFADQKQSDINALYLFQGGTSLPSKDYYFSDAFAKVREQFQEHVAKMFVLLGDAPDTAAKEAATVLAVETALAEHMKTPVELRDRLANYNRMTFDELAALVPAFPIRQHLIDSGFDPKATDYVVVGQPKFFEGLNQIIASRPVRDFKIYLRYRVVSGAAPLLAAPFEQEHFRFYSTVLRGTPQMEPRWQRAARATDNALGEALGQLYVAKHYPPEAKARMDEMIKNIKAVMRDRLTTLEWMSPATREKAVAKFDRFVARIGHTDQWRDYSSVAIARGSYFENARAAAAFESKRNRDKLGQPVDKGEWGMTPPTVNAYFQPTANQIVFPAGILQPPFFDFTMDDAVNYGMIGGVIGHEITHGFDDQGRRYDADGNLTDWWTPEDDAQFRARAQKLIDQYSSYEALPGLKVNGALSLGENVADLGGTSIAYEAFQRSLQGKPTPPKIDGFTAEQRFFISWAQGWRTAYREDAMRRQVMVGPHAPGNFRAIGALVNFQPFFDAFGIKEGDPMWRKPEDRTKIW
ncbi:MAG: M13 family metallopeptidase [Candidatus Didemnitutus sp.]|nr:M13 family metallopeptidase [Candidatus Didemnitutus sp.]